MFKVLRDAMLSISIASAFIASSTASEQSDNCWESAGMRYQVDPWLLYAIASVESNLDPLAINDDNADGTRDIGIMQINSFWLPLLAKYGISENDLFEPCTSIHVGAWILSTNIARFGETWWAVGAYNVGTGRDEKRELLREKYATRVRNTYLNLIGGL